MRVRKKKWAEGELFENPLILEGKACGISKFFQEPGLPLHLEIGCGKGRFVTEMSLVLPGVNFAALERDDTIVAHAARLARQRGAGNVRFIIDDVDNVEDYFSPGDISRMYINFCDPWPTKKKRARRRLTHGRYLEVYERLLVPEIHFKTDSRILFEFSLESFSQRGWKLSNISLDLHRSGFLGNIVTEYEERFSALGPIYRLEAKKECE